MFSKWKHDNMRQKIEFVIRFRITAHIHVCYQYLCLNRTLKVKWFCWQPERLHMFKGKLRLYELTAPSPGLNVRKSGREVMNPGRPLVDSKTSLFCCRANLTAAANTKRTVTLSEAVDSFRENNFQFNMQIIEQKRVIGCIQYCHKCSCH